MKKIIYGTIISCCFIFISCSTLEKNKQDPRFSATLNWGIDPLSKKSWTKTGIQENILVKKELDNVLNSAQKDLEKKYEISAVNHIEKEGKLNSDPLHSASNKALEGTESILKWAICSALATNPIAQRCFDAAHEGIIKWVDLYQPSGNPVNDHQLLRLFLAIDLIMDKSSIKDQEIIKKWVKLFISKGDELFANLPKGFTVNNWMTWRLVIRSLAANIVQDSKIILETKKLVSAHVSANLNPPLNWTPDLQCKNNENESRYGGYDFRRRDALHYHVYNLEAWSWLAVFTPEVMDQQTMESVTTAFDFLRPYYLGEKTHIEFVCSKIQFDKKRTDAGQFEFQNKDWEPKRARNLLRLARSKFLAIRDWSENVVDENYRPWIKFLSATQEQVK